MTIKVRGLKEIEALLEKLPDRISANVLNAALRRGASVIAKEARKNLRASPSIDSALLEKSISSRARRQKRKGKYVGRAVVSIGAQRVTTQVVRKGHKKPVTATPSKYAHLVEFGTRKMKAEPFLRPALDTKGAEAIAVIGEAMSKRISAEAAKMAAGKVSFATGRKI